MQKGPRSSGKRGHAGAGASWEQESCARWCAVLHPGRFCKDTGFDRGTGWKVVSTPSASSKRAADWADFMVASCHRSLPQSLRGCSEGPLQGEVHFRPSPQLSRGHSDQPSGLLQTEARLRVWSFCYEHQESPMKTRMSVSAAGKLSKKHQCSAPTQDRGSGPAGRDGTLTEFQRAARGTSPDPVQTPGGLSMRKQK